jgi:hypothetical protein
MNRAGIPENLSIRSLVAVINVYASEIHHGKTVAVSRAAQQAIGRRGATVLEHGTPRYEFTRLFAKAHRENRLSEDLAKGLIQKYWVVAHVTKEEDQRLRDLGLRSKMMDTPFDRWSAAGFVFTEDERLQVSDAITGAVQLDVGEIEDGSETIKVKQPETKGVNRNNMSPNYQDRYGSASLHDFLGRYGGNLTSIRNQIVEYLFNKRGLPSTLGEIAKKVGHTTHFGPGKGEVCTASHVQSALHHIKRRLEKRKLPFAIREDGHDVITLVYTG